MTNSSIYTSILRLELNQIYIMQNQAIRSIDLFCNDLYQFTCSYSYFLQNKHQQTASFEVFFRKYPFKGQYVIFTGLESVKDFIQSFKFTQEHENFLKKTFPEMKQQYFDWIRQDFSKKVSYTSMKQGEIVFANEPLITYTGPLGFVQLLQTPCLNLLGFASLVATNASRMVKAVTPKRCLEFGTRRAQGPDGALSAAQYAYIGGFSGTSNVYAASKLDLHVVGTMSHAYVTSFDSLADVEEFQINGVNIVKRTIERKKQLGVKTHEGQLAAFLSYARSFPNNFTTLIDTYSTVESGMINNILVAGALYEAGVKKIGIRLDSGDLCELSKQCRSVWRKYFPEKQKTLWIVASDDLYEERLLQIEANGSQIDVYAIGTNIATCKKQPALGLVCKLVELDNNPKMKLSSTPEKATYPGLKSIYRVKSQSGQIFDLIALNSEEIVNNSQIRMGTLNTEQTQIKIQSAQLLNGELDFKRRNIEQIKSYSAKRGEELPSQLFDLKNPKRHQVFMTQQYLQVFKQTLKKAQISAETN